MIYRDKLLGWIRKLDLDSISYTGAVKSSVPERHHNNNPQQTIGGLHLSVFSHSPRGLLIMTGKKKRSDIHVNRILSASTTH